MENKQQSEWETLPQLYSEFVAKHPELMLVNAQWALTNILRGCRAKLVKVDAIRKAGRHWIGHRERFDPALFDLLTGKDLEQQP